LNLKSVFSKEFKVVLTVSFEGNPALIMFRKKGCLKDDILDDVKGFNTVDRDLGKN